MNDTSFAAAQDRLLHRHGVRARSRRIEIAGPVRHAHVLDAGSGPPVLLVHGGGGFSAQWAPLLAALQDHHRLLAVDRPGFGLTDRFSYADGPQDLRAHAVGFLDAVLDALALDRVPIVANSMGALWSLWLATARPERVERLVLAGAPALLLDSHAPLRMRAQAHRVVGPILRRRGGGAPASAAAVRAAYEELGDPVAAADPAFVAAVLAHRARPGEAVAFGPLVRRVTSLRGQRGICFGAAELRRLELPVRLVWGTRDNFADADVGRRAAALLPHGELRVVAGGHLPWLTSPSRVAALAREFLARPKPVRPTVDRWWPRLDRRP